MKAAYSLKFDTGVTRAFPFWLRVLAQHGYTLAAIADTTTRRSVAAGLDGRGVELPRPGVAWPSSESGRR